VIDRFEIPQENQNIFAELSHDNKSKDLCILVHGFKGFYKWGFFRYIKERLLARGIATLAFNFSHNGVLRHGDEITEFNVFRKNTFGRELNDFVTIKNFIESDKFGFHYENLYSLSHSRGGFTNLLFASENPNLFDRIVTLAAVSHYINRFPETMLSDYKQRGYAEFLNSRTGDMLKIDYGFQEEVEKNHCRFDLLSKLSKINSKLLLIHGDKDETIPVNELELLYQSSNKKLSTKKIIVGAGHTFNYDRKNALLTRELNEAINHSLSFFKQ
jgi:uncharacterized protein